VPLNDVTAFRLGTPLAGLVDGGIVFVQSAATDPVAVWEGIPPSARETIVARGLRVLALDTARIARETTGQPDLVQRMQGIVLLGVFLRVAPFVERRGLAESELFAAVERSLRKFFGKRGETVIGENLRAVRRGYHEVFDIKVPAHE
jgi:pyruvate-ferredoxin/flavodoxin oxidoreductase